MFGDGCPCSVLTAIVIKQIIIIIIITVLSVSVLNWAWPRECVALVSTWSGLGLSGPNMPSSVLAYVSLAGPLDPD